MGRASSKKVARAASTGGGRTARGARPLGWYAAMALVVLLGVGGIVTSRADRRQEFAAGADPTPPVARKDHWHAAIGFYLCDQFAPHITDERDPLGIHTHGDGVIHIHPTVRRAAGAKATLGLYADAVRLTLTDDEIQLPGGKSFEEGETKCGDKPGIVQVRIDGEKVITENIRDIRYTDGQRLTVAFAPRGAELPNPPSESQLNNLEDVPNPSAPPGLPTDLPLEPPPDGQAPEGQAPEGQPEPTPAPDASTPPSQP